MENDLVVIIMAGGLGTRMESDIPKVIHKLAGLPMINHILRNLRKLKNIKQIKMVSFYLRNKTCESTSIGCSVNYPGQKRIWFSVKNIHSPKVIESPLIIYRQIMQ